MFITCKRNYHSKYRPPTTNKSDNQFDQCDRALYQVNQFPAKDAMCGKYHFQHMCRYRSVAAVNVQSTDYQFQVTITSLQVDTTEIEGNKI